MKGLCNNETKFLTDWNTDMCKTVSRVQCKQCPDVPQKPCDGATPIRTKKDGFCDKRGCITDWDKSTCKPDKPSCTTCPKIEDKPCAGATSIFTKIDGSCGKGRMCLTS